MNTVGPAVRHLRHQQGLSQKQLAARCNVLGWAISRGTLAKIEAPVRRVMDREVVWRAAVLRVPVEQEDTVTLGTPHARSMTIVG